MSKEHCLRDAQRRTTWLSRDLAEFAMEHGLGRAGQDSEDAGACFDVVIVGSGYGGAVALAELAGLDVDRRPLKIAMLERGSEYLPGAFPSRLSELAGHVRFSTRAGAKPGGVAEGLFDIRVGPDVGVVLASGLGGGSLINAGVMAAPLPEVFEETCWPDAIRSDERMLARLACMKRRLQAKAMPEIAERVTLMDAVGGDKGRSKAVEATIALSDDADRGVTKCANCCDCATGCNIGAKLSVDVSLIADAVSRHPQGELHIVSGATVQSFRRRRTEKRDAGWTLQIVHTNADLHRKQRKPYRLHTARLIVAAGSLGSTELLLRSRSGELRFSAMLGERFSANGDNIAAIYGTAEPTKAVGDEAEPYQDRGGPTINRMIDRRTEPTDSIVVQEIAVPAALRRLFEEATAAASAVDSMTLPDPTSYVKDVDPPDPAGIDQDKVSKSAVLAVLGRDSAGGRLALPPEGANADCGTLGVVWPEVRDAPGFDDAQAALEKLVLPGVGKVLRNPAWRPLPASLEAVIGKTRGPVMTVHPLGGCAMADSAAAGVVDEWGRVFNAAENEVFDDLVVLDGSIVPCSLGINPALTIAALAQRAIRSLRRAWGFASSAPSASGSPPMVWPRPRLRDAPAPLRAEPTRFEITEQMTGSVWLDLGTEPVECRAELQLWFDAVGVNELIAADAKGRVLRCNGTRSRLRLVSPSGSLLLQAPLTGTLRLLRHEPSSPWWRMARGGFALLLNRGLRDLFDLWRAGDLWRQLRGRWGLALALASRAGDVRLLEYVLTVGKPRGGGDPRFAALHWEGKPISAVKRLTYGLAADPVSQLMKARLLRFPHAMLFDGGRTLTVDLRYFGRMGVPLLRIEKQADQINALVDAAALALYFVRVLLPIYAGVFRSPYYPPPRKACRLPGDIDGLTRTVTELAVATLPDGRPVHLRLTRYRQSPTDGGRPVLMIHGYSASGTMFAHPALPGGGLAAELARKGHDAWVLDLRSSAGMPGAQEPWWFEQMGCEDIPLAIDHVLRHTGHQQLDVVAHCMGAAMLSLGLFGKWPERVRRDGRFGRHEHLRRQMPARLRRLVLSQVGPVVDMSASNIARAYIMQWLRHYMAFDRFEFTPAGLPDARDEMLDRLLALVPRSRADFCRTYPLWRPCWHAPWASTRQRVDALYGETFRLDQMSDAVLEAIDDFLGPLHLQTVAQTILFARNGAICDHSGDAVAMVPGKIGRRLTRGRAPGGAPVQVLCIHGRENKLVDVATSNKLRSVFEAAGIGVETAVFEHRGHLDCLIGREAQAIYARIAGFLAAEGPAARHEPYFKLRPPRAFLAPVRIGANGSVSCTVSYDSANGVPQAAFLVPRERIVFNGMRPNSSAIAGVAIPPPGEVDSKGSRAIEIPGLKWPDGADAALLLLRHAQVEGAGDVAFPSPLSVDPTPPAIAPARVLAAFDEVEKGVLEPGELERGTIFRRDAFRRDADESSFRFALASCQYPAGMIDGGVRIPSVPATASGAGPAGGSLWRLAERMRRDDGSNIRLAVLAGDQIYADATAGLFDPAKLSDALVFAYERMFENAGMQRLLRTSGLDVLTLFDDHEVADNWEPLPAPPKDDKELKLDAARRAYWLRQRAMWPGGAGARPGTLWKELALHGHRFFVADTRSERAGRDVGTLEAAQIMGERQADRLDRWIRSLPGSRVPRFVVSPAMLLPRRLELRGDHPAMALHSDNWDGYPRSLHRVLAALFEANANDVVFLSGNEHLACVATITIERKGCERKVTVHSIHAPALYAPYPFANAQAHDFAHEDRFGFDLPGDSSYTCTVVACFPVRGNGFALVKPIRDGGGGWRLDVEFDMDDGARANPCSLEIGGR